MNNPSPNIPTIRQQAFRPTEFDPELRARLTALDAASDEHAQEQRPANTVRSYEADWRTWTAFCEQFGIPTTAATRGTLRAFVDFLWNREKRAYATIDRKLAGVTVTLRTRHGVIVDPESTKAARELLKDYRRRAREDQEPERGRGKAPAMLVEALSTIVSKCSDDIFGVRDQAVLLLGYAIAARRAELAGLLLRNIHEDDNGLLVDVMVSKTAPRTVPVPYGQNEATCPVRAWERWRERARISDPDRAAFRRIHHTGAVQPQGLTPQRIGDIVTAAGARAGFEVLFTGHSVRSGMATQARRMGKDVKAIAAVTGHKENSGVLHGYLHIVDRWNEKDNALIDIGL